MFKPVFRVFHSQYLPDGTMEIYKTPGIHCSAVAEPIHGSSLHSLQEQQRNELFADARNISTPPHYIPIDEPCMKKEENTQLTKQYYMLNTWLSDIAPINHYRFITSCSLSVTKGSPHAKLCGEVELLGLPI